MSVMKREPVKFGILTVSDRCHRKETLDESGDNLESQITSGSLLEGVVSERACVPDEEKDIMMVLENWSDKKALDVILTTGGTGFSPRDVTPEATKRVISKAAPGLSLSMFNSSLKITPMAMLSRAVCGIRGKTLIVNLPGSKKASQECLETVVPALTHAVDLLRDDTKKVKAMHVHVQASSGSSGCTHFHGLHNPDHGDGKSGVDTTHVARRPRESPYPLKSVAEAQTILLNECLSLGVETVHFMLVHVHLPISPNVLHPTDVQKTANHYRDALGRTISEDIFAPDPLPPFPASIKDGYAVISSDGKGPRRVLGDSSAGSVPEEEEAVLLQPGSCVRIATGAPVPPGADAVVQVEDTQLLEEKDDGQTEVSVDILVSPHPGQEIRPIGCDVQQGQKVMLRGTEIGPAELGLLATVGAVQVKVYRQPKVGVLSTGNELQEPEGPLLPGKIRDSNRSLLLALLKENGFPAVDLGIALDRPESLLAKLKDGLSCCDLVVTTGGASMSERDLLKAVLATDLQAQVHFGRVFMKPGKPTIFATCVYNGIKKLILGLPGNPVSAAVTSHLYVLPACRKMSNCSNPMYTTVRAMLNDDMQLDPRPEFYRAILSWKEGQSIPIARGTGNQLSSRLLSFSSANAFLVLPPRKPEASLLKKGTEVDAIIIRKL